MTDLFLEPLRFVVLAGLGIFLIRTLQAMQADLRAALPPDERPAQAPPPEEPQLIVEEGIGAIRSGQIFPVQEEMLIGRSPAAHLVLTDKFVSLRHARLTRRNGSLWVSDLGSSNGTFVNDRQVTAPVRLGQGDRLRIGRIILRLQWPQGS